jgi:hypothetical protein
MYELTLKMYMSAFILMYIYIYLYLCINIYACIFKYTYIYLNIIYMNIYRYTKIGASSFAPASFAESIPFIGNYFGEEMSYWSPTYQEKKTQTQVYIYIYIYIYIYVYYK